jgi:hypothetical protein
MQVPTERLRMDSGAANTPTFSKTFNANVRILITNSRSSQALKSVFVDQKIK